MALHDASPGSRSPTRQIFTGSGTYTTPDGCVAILVECVGGGGGGGGTPATNGTSPGTTAAAGGGRGGSYASSLIRNPAASYAVTVGSGGSGSAGASGGDGADTTFGSTVVVAGAGKGAPLAVKDIGTFPDTSGSVGGPNNASTGDIVILGGIAQSGYIFSAALPISGAGGSGSVYGTFRGGASSGGTFPGGNAVGYGSGGNGACAVASAAAQAGGSGNAGVCIVTEFYN